MSVKDKIHKYEEAEKVSPQDEVPREAEKAVEKEPEPLQGKLDAALAESQQHYDRLLRVSAEFDNYKKRSCRDMDDFRKFANEAILKDLLHVVDNLERAIASEAGDSCVLEGVKMTLSEILKIFSRFGVTPIDAVGEMFDPAFHQAILQEASDQHPRNTVLKEMQKGYRLHDRLLRPAMVVVSETTGAAPAETKSEDDK